MKIVISGGLGYVGGRLCKYLTQNGHQVVALSRQANSFADKVWPAGLTVRSPEEMLLHPVLMKNADAFIHLAALNEFDCVKYPDEAISVNIGQTLHWLEAAREQWVKKFVYFSTAHVYGKPLEGYYDEDSICRPLHPYAITHKCAEDYVINYAIEKGMDNYIVRLTNSFGGPAFATADRWTLLVNDLCRSAVTTGKMLLQSDGLQLRDFICLEDVCNGIEHLLVHVQKQPNCIYNLGAGYSRSVWDMAKDVKAIADKTLGKEIALERKEPRSVPSTATLTIGIDKLLASGFSLKNDIKEEITSTLHYFINHS